MRYVLKKARRVTVNDIVTKKHKFTIVEIKSASLNNGQDTQFAEGANNTQLAAFDSKKIFDNENITSESKDGEEQKD